MKIRLNKMLVLVLVLALMATTAYALPNNNNGNGPDNAPGQIKKSVMFNDLEGFSWAERYIERMAKKDVIKGVGNGAFMPGGTAKEIETITMLIRELGWENELDEDAILPEDYKGKKPSDWMTPYIELAVDKGLITDVENFDPNYPTKRSKAAVYFVRAADILDGYDYIGDADDSMDEILPFNDFNAIPKEHIGYVYVALELGLIQGYPDKNFQPNKAINRAELAAMMARLDEDYESDFSYSLIAKIENINLEDDEITLLYRGNEKTYDLADDVSVYMDNNEDPTLEDLEVNMIVKVYIQDNEIIEINFRSDDYKNVVQKRYEGEVLEFSVDFDEIIIEEDNEVLNFEITDDTRIHVEVLDNELIQDFVGLNAKVIAKDSIATQIWIELNEEEGILTGLNYQDEELISVDVELDDSTTKTFIFFEDIKILIDDEYDELTEDFLYHKVKMKLLANDEVVKISVDTEVEIEDLEELIEDVYELDEENYSTDTWASLLVVLADAEAVLADEYATQYEIDQAYEDLADAVDDLTFTE